MPALLAWLGRLLPVLFSWLLRAWKSWIGQSFVIKVVVITSVAALMPLPSWLTGLPAKLGLLPSSFLFFAELAQLRFGLLVVFGAMVLRWTWNKMLAALG
jgi:hypothetical protein